MNEKAKGAWKKLSTFGPDSNIVLVFLEPADKIIHAMPPAMQFIVGNSQGFDMTGEDLVGKTELLIRELKMRQMT